jgi:hypothetical protein
MFRDRFRRAGGAPTVFPSLLELTNAADAGLAPGYYQVLDGIPPTHPMRNRVVSFWDGEDFHPKISTGWEQIPFDFDTRVGWCWDAKETFFRNVLTEGMYLSGLQNLISGHAIGSQLFSSSVFSTLNGAPRVYEDRWELRRGSTSDALCWGPLLTTGDSHLMVFAGKKLVSGGWSQTVLFVGRALGSGGISLQARGDSGAGLRDEWGVNLSPTTYGTSTAFTYSTQVECRPVEGDVVILHYDKPGLKVRMWVNGVDFGPQSVAQSVSFGANSLTGLGNIEGANQFCSLDASFFAITNVPVEDFQNPEAQALTSWLQSRYGIPGL